MKNNIDYFAKLKKDVIDAGICTHCGTCIGLFPEKLTQIETTNGPLPLLKNKRHKINDPVVYNSCPALGIKYTQLNKFVFNQKLKNFLLGNYLEGYVGYSNDHQIRRKSASGGIITTTLIYLLENKMIDGAVVLKQGIPKPWLAKPMIARTREEIMACSQSVYIPVMVNTILAEIKNFKGKLAYVGLPDQVAAIRKLQMDGNKDALKIKYILGPYVGTAIYLDAIKSYLRSNGVKSLDEVKLLKYRDGEWPGYLRIDTKDGRTFKSSKFYYNYLIPFYITKSSLLSVDFTNELTDISVGDAWHPKYEKIGKGFSVVLARTSQGHTLLENMKKHGLITIEKQEYSQIVNMHGHMIDFKKRGAFIRIQFLKFFGRKYPKYDYSPKRITLSRYIIESFISFIFYLGRSRIIRRFIEYVPLAILGPLFNFTRKSWKSMSKSTKRKGIKNIEFEIINN